MTGVVTLLEEKGKDRLTVNKDSGSEVKDSVTKSYK